MIISINNKVKAFLLLSVFSLNTVVGFACSLGVDMGFNSKHHHEATEAVVHIHADGKKHIHQQEKKGHYNHDKSQHHEKGIVPKNSKSDNGNCCNDQVLKFEQLDKSVPYSLHISHPLFLIAFSSTVNNNVFCPAGVAKDIKQFVRSYHPPISDIYIAVQSFRI